MNLSSERHYIWRQVGSVGEVDKGHGSPGCGACGDLWSLLQARDVVVRMCQAFPSTFIPGRYLVKVNENL